MMFPEHNERRVEALASRPISARDKSSLDMQYQIKTF